MGYSTISVPFFTEDITIQPHTATCGSYLGRPVTIGEFAQGRPCSLQRVMETGEYIVTAGGSFIQGPEI